VSAPCVADPRHWLPAVCAEQRCSGCRWSAGSEMPENRQVN
jgi:hypothetical protein